jgi:hypothetical protein
MQGVQLVVLLVLQSSHRQMQQQRWQERPQMRLASHQLLGAGRPPEAAQSPKLQQLGRVRAAAAQASGAAG